MVRSTFISVQRRPPGKEKNWLRTVPGKGYFVILRLYGPTEPLLNQTWRPGDMEEMKVTSGRLWAS